MQVQIVSQGVELTDTDRDYLNQKISHLTDFEEVLKDDGVHAHVRVAWEGGKSKAGHVVLEATIFMPGAIIRAESYAATAQEAGDICLEKLKRQVDKYKAKRHRRDKSGQWIPVSTLEQISDVEAGYESQEEENVVLKRKKLVNAPTMHEEEALHQLELLDHDFFVYKNVETGVYNIAYRRHKGGYGVLELEG